MITKLEQLEIEYHELCEVIESQRQAIKPLQKHKNALRNKISVYKLREKTKKV